MPQNPFLKKKRSSTVLLPGMLMATMLTACASGKPYVPPMPAPPRVLAPPAVLLKECPPPPRPSAEETLPASYIEALRAWAICAAQMRAITEYFASLATQMEEQEKAGSEK